MEQVIYTYCKQLINGAGGGWGFYSYSSKIKDYFENNSALKDMVGGHGYTTPKNKSCWLVSPLTNPEEDLKKESESIKLYHPEKFSYTKLYIDGEEKVVLSYGKNLGREPKNYTRPANKLVYTLMGNSDEMKEYPCFYSRNTEFDKMTREYFKNADDTKPASLLETIELNNKEGLTITEVIEFILGNPKYEDILINMFYAFLEAQQNEGQTLIICDKNANIKYWIAAITLLFPIDIAKDIFFSTYDALGESDTIVDIPENIHICGVYSPTYNGAGTDEATNYDAEKIMKREDVIVFDIEKNILPTYSTDSFACVIKEFCHGKVDSLYEYHKYIKECTSYRYFGKEYTKFYPTNETRIELFKYYSEEVQKEIYAENYKKCFDIWLDDLMYTQIVNVIDCGISCGIADIPTIEKDITDFVVEKLLDIRSDYKDGMKIDALASAIKTSYEDIIKEQLLTNEELLNQILEEELLNHNIDFILNLFNPFVPEENIILNKFLKKLSVNTNRENISGKYLLKWMEKFFGSSIPIKEPEDIMVVANLIPKEKNRLTDFMTRYFIEKWDEEYCKRILEYMENCELAKDFYTKLEEATWGNNRAFELMYKFIGWIRKNNSSLAMVWYQTYIAKAIKASPEIRKFVAEKIINDNDFVYIESVNDLLKSVFESYNFYNAQDLAKLSYMSCIRIEGILSSDYFIPLVRKNIMAQDLAKLWKKTLNSLEIKNIDRELDKEVKKELLLILKSKDDNESEDYKEKKTKKNAGGLKKIFGKK